MTLEEIQAAIKEGKTVLDPFGSIVRYVSESGYIREGNPKFYRYPDLFQDFTIQKPGKTWPQIGDTYYKVLFDTTSFEFSKGVWENTRDENEKVRWGDIYKSKKGAMKEIKKFLDNLI